MVPETEIVDCLVMNFRLAAEHCDDLAVLPARGPTYDLLRKELSLIEGCCRQIGHYREDARWMRIGLLVEEAHKRAGHWLRTIPRTSESNEAHPLFRRLAENLRAGMKAAEELRTKRTGRVGMILPRPLPGPLRQGRPVQVVTPGGVILPSGYQPSV
jgi:hypothetical protein